VATREVRSGDVLRLERGGGGGYADPWERDPGQVLSDVRNGYVSLEGARRSYGVVVTDDRSVIDQEETARLRAARAPGAGV
jgi:N-methylhydantoinase B